jgi:hypothetical protein
MYKHSGQAFEFTEAFTYDCGLLTDHMIDRTVKSFYSPAIISNSYTNTNNKVDMENDFLNGNTVTEKPVKGWTANLSGQYQIVDNNLFADNPTFGGFLIRDLTTDNVVRYGPELSYDHTPTPIQANFDPINVTAGHNYELYYVFKTSNKNKTINIHNGTKTAFHFTVKFEYYERI